MRIRQLEWEQVSHWTLMTKEIGFKGHFTIRRAVDGFSLEFNLGWIQGAAPPHIGTYPTIDECKLVAQAKFEEWVRATFFAE